MISSTASWQELSAQIPKQFSWMASLTPAERWVAIHVRQGLSNREIAAVLGKSAATVKCQVMDIMRKLSTPTRCRLIVRLHDSEG